jgi:hypothetical protein
MWVPIFDLTSALSLSTSTETQMATKAMAGTATIIPLLAAVIPTMEVAGPTVRPLADSGRNLHNSTQVPRSFMNAHAHWLLN